MRKGVSGYVITIVITLVLAVIGLTLLWIFLQNTVKGGESFANDVTRGICQSLRKLGIFSSVFGEC